MPEGALRVAFVAGTLNAGGAEKQLVHMAQALTAAGVDVAVFSLGLDNERYAVRLRDMGIRLWTSGPRISRAVRMYRLLRELRRFNPDIIQASHFYVGLYAAIAGALLKRPVLGAVRSDLRNELRIHGRWGRWLFRWPNAIVANSQAAIDNALHAGLDAARMRLVTNVIVPQPIAAEGEAVNGGRGVEVVAIVVANLIEVKRLDRFIEALARARTRYPALRAVIVGAGPLGPELASLAAARDLGGALRFTGAAADVGPLVATADFLCLTSANEGSPNVILEAMAAGLPVIAMNAGDVGRIVDDGITGFVVPQNDISLFASMMVALASNPQLRQRMGSEARARIEEHFSVRRLAPQLIATYRELASKRADMTLFRKLDRIEGVA